MSATIEGDESDFHIMEVISFGADRLREGEEWKLLSVERKISGSVFMKDGPLKGSQENSQVSYVFCFTMLKSYRIGKGHKRPVFAYNVTGQYSRRQKSQSFFCELVRQFWKFKK